MREQPPKSQTLHTPINRRCALQTLGALAAAAAGLRLEKAWAVKPLPPHIAAQNAAIHLLRKLSPLEAPAFEPRLVIEAINTLQPLGQAAGVAAIRAFITQTESAGRECPGALFAVMRLLFDPPSPKAPTPTEPYDLTTAARPGYLRPPALGAPSPPASTDPAMIPHFPILLMADLPLSVVDGYALGGQPEPPSMHLDALCAGCTWRTAPLDPKTPGEVRYLLTHWGGLTPDQLPLAFEQLDRLEKP